MAQPSFPEYLDHLKADSARFRDVLAACDPEAAVPSCPAWTAADLLWHLTDVQRFWAGCLRERPAQPERSEDQDDSGRPTDYQELLAAFDDSHRELMAAFEGADPAEAAWTWSSDPAHHTVAFIGRRQALEALVHRLDAEQTAGRVTPLDPTLSADGVQEVLDVMYGGCPPWGSFAPLPHYLRVDCTDTGDSVWVQLGQFSGTDPEGTDYHEDDISVVDDPGVEPDAVVAGAAPVLLARLWRRGDGADLRLSGDLALVDHFRRAIHHPIN